MERYIVLKVFIILLKPASVVMVVLTSALLFADVTIPTNQLVVPLLGATAQIGRQIGVDMAPALESILAQAGLRNLILILGLYTISGGLWALADFLSAYIAQEENSTEMVSLLRQLVGQQGLASTFTRYSMWDGQSDAERQLQSDVEHWREQPAAPPGRWWDKSWQPAPTPAKPKAIQNYLSRPRPPK